jgi:hypothetical protein
VAGGSGLTALTRAVHLCPGSSRPRVSFDEPNVPEMSELRVLIGQYGLLVVFAAVFLSRMGLPVPAFPVLLTAAAMTAGGARAVGGLALAGVGGGLIADIGWFTASRRYGGSFLRFLCKISVSPDSQEGQWPRGEIIAVRRCARPLVRLDARENASPRTGRTVKRGIVRPRPGSKP